MDHGLRVPPVLGGAVVHCGHVLVLAVGGAGYALRGRRALTAVPDLAALARPANVAAVVWASLHAVASTAACVLAWLPFAAYLLMWVAAVVGLVAAGRGWLRRA